MEACAGPAFVAGETCRLAGLYRATLPCRSSRTRMTFSRHAKAAVASIPPCGNASVRLEESVSAAKTAMKTMNWVAQAALLAPALFFTAWIVPTLSTRGGASGPQPAPPGSTAPVPSP